MLTEARHLFRAPKSASLGLDRRVCVESEVTESVPSRSDWRAGISDADGIGLAQGLAVQLRTVRSPGRTVRPSDDGNPMEKPAETHEVSCSTMVLPARLAKPLHSHNCSNEPPASLVHEPDIVRDN
jgi:hypothetical protein